MTTITKFHYLANEFLATYASRRVPFTELGEFVYLRTYSRFLEQEGRREQWEETIKRAIEYNIDLERRFHPGADIEALRKEAEELFENMFYLRQFPSGRTLWVGGTDVADSFPIANFNCSFLVMDSFEGFCEQFYLLMIGSGVGFRTMPYDVEKIPSFRTGISLTSKPYLAIQKELRKEFTNLDIEGNRATILVGDSKEGWITALELYFKLLTSFLYKNVEHITVNFDHVRGKGEKLVRFGGTSSGHTSLETMFHKVHKVMMKTNGKLMPIDALDIGNIIAENVVSGGVRRSSEINLASKDDMDIEHAKNNMYYQENGEWKENQDILHRRMSNNSIFYEDKPTREELHENFKNMRFTGERGFVNAKAGRKRREDFAGLNPCAEILLADRGLCNLSTVNMLSFVEDGELQKTKLYRAFELSARLGFRMTLPELEIERWNAQKEKDRLIGCSVTGYFDMVDAVGLTTEEQIDLLRTLKRIVRNTVDEYAKKLGVNPSLLATTVKPEGTLSQLPSVSSGIHRSHSPFFIRRVRISAHDPLAKVVTALGYPILPESGQTWENAATLVVEFPVQSTAKVVKAQVSAIEQLETYKMFQDHYTEHNTSITVTVRSDEWEDVEQWVWEHWDNVVAVSFLPLDDAVYPLMPYEEITEEEYYKRKVEMKPFDASLLNEFEKTQQELDLGSDGCDTGACPVR
ncbi:ribonucleoside-triphosphate reductase, adenosylcobalamin-dependent [Aureibacillus halotolerans]|uniref:Adenosylcobalamin-dependent ribonucleoside-triphosphate reductase n=1 Tax=Aureibacillus halotolerans TaxID=1508390 RepID=A0A4R6U3X1_9BACI|nr:ribonucleoside-triphosphate reductase, adenosylcobalamin-dependent [Aureibacillus halotolerans]TDQ41120.1 ribonucleoside-diphosphate reductase alpha chain/ribonucleoside-triphosphate reductase [Aureibacillus halotolerans]